MSSLFERAWRMRVRAQLSDPWTLLVSAVGGGAAWAVGLPVVAAVGVGAGMVAVAGVASVFRSPGETPVNESELRRGSEQAALVDALDGYLSDLRDLRQSQRLPALLTDSAIEALVAAGGARRSALRVAEAVDGLDAAIARTQALAGRSSAAAGAVSAGTVQTVARMAARRTGLLRRLSGVLDQVQEVHANLLELAATLELPTGGTEATDIETVNRRLDEVRTTFAALKTDAMATSWSPTALGG